MILIGYGICIVLTWVMYYLFLPALTISSVGFWFFLMMIAVLFLGVSSLDWDGLGKPVGAICIGLCVISVVVLIIGGLSSSALFRASSYVELIESNIVRKDISEYTPSIDDVPLMDKATAELVANRRMGTLVDVVSQYELGESVQINYNNRPIRVVPLKYSGFFKWMNNKNVGIPSYISVDMTNQTTEIHNLEQGIRYSPSGCFGDDLNRLLRFKYPTTLLGKPVFEIDEEGNPYWVVAKLEHRVGLFGGKDVSGVLTVDAITGEIIEYSLDDIPSYIDNVYPTNILLDLYNGYGKYQGGFWNSMFGQKGVIQATEGYNYIPHDDDIYVYTGVTSVVSDESNVGFIFMNKRTKEIEYYEVAGAEEYSAMESAEGVVQHLGYKSTFPLLLQIEGQPTYCVALKDAGGLVKMYGLVNMTQYQIVVTGETMTECLAKYRTALQKSGQSVIEVEMSDNSGVVEDIRTANIDGTTYFYIKIEGSPIYYAFSITDNEEIVLVNIGDEIEFDITVGSMGSIIRAILK